MKRIILIILLIAFGATIPSEPSFKATITVNITATSLGDLHKIEKAIEEKCNEFYGDEKFYDIKINIKQNENRQ